MKLNIDITKDDMLPKNAVDILRDRYMLPEEISPQESFARACMAFADNKAHAERLYKYVSNLWFMFATLHTPRVLGEGRSDSFLWIKSNVGHCVFI